jgi:hypothetical protein
MLHQGRGEGGGHGQSPKWPLSIHLGSRSLAQRPCVAHHLQWVCDYACPPHGHCPFPSWAVRKSNAEHSRHSCCPYSGDTSFTLLTAHCGLLNAWSPGTCCWEMGPSRQSLGLWGPALEKTVVPLYFLILFLFLVGDMSSLLHHPLPPQCAILTVPRQMETRDFVLEPVEL